MKPKICRCCGEPIEESAEDGNPNICRTCKEIDTDHPEDNVVAINHEVQEVAFTDLVLANNERFLFYDYQTFDRRT
jgi:hypothetical protein